MSNCGSYSVGWVCALDTEYVAARCMLDEKYDGPEVLSTNDNNNYTLGRIKQHHVVIAVLPDGQYGTTSATAVLKDMLHSFPNIRTCLMVGIGGGAPSQKHDIRFGDIVVSAPRDGGGSVFQYDFGKTTQGQPFQPKGYLSPPPVFLRTAINGLKTKYEEEGHRFEDTINGILQKNRRLQRKYKRPDPSTDRLYKSDVIHPPDETECATCCGDDPSKLISRPERNEDEDDPAIHYGLIASANQLMKDASVRDRLIAENDVLCFEMEAAGLMSQFPCLIIRGICDYSDSHKNKEWQGYAAMTAAAYAKDLLYEIAPTKIEAERKIADIPGVLSSIESKLRDIQTSSETTSNTIEHLSSDHHQEKIKRWISPLESSTNLDKALRKRHEGSGLWLLEDERFRTWKTERCSFLWLEGSPGAGKTILCSTIIDNLSPQNLLYYYYDFNDLKKQQFESMIRALTYQLYYKCHKASTQLDSLFSSCINGLEQPVLKKLIQAFSDMLAQAEETWIVLDALDECNKGCRDELLTWMSEILNQATNSNTNVHLLVTSRPEEDIKSAITQFADANCRVSLQSSLTADDIGAYVRWRVRDSDDFRRWKTHPDVQGEIESILITKADGMFRWVACQLDVLKECLDYRRLSKALVSLPETLDETYSRILNGISKEYIRDTIKLLQFLVYSERPIYIEEAVDIIAVDTEGSPYFDPKYRMPNQSDILRCCASLVIAVPVMRPSFHPRAKFARRTELHLAHFSVKEYLMSDRLKDDLVQNFRETCAKASMAKTCLAYLLDLQLEIGTPALMIGDAFPLVTYCIRCWVGLAVVAERLDEALQYFIRRLFDDRRCFFEDGYHTSVWSTEWMPKISEPSGTLESKLCFASWNGLTNAVKYLIDQGADVNRVVEYHRKDSPFAIGTVIGAQIITHWMSVGPRADLRGLRGETRLMTALEAAAENGSYEIVELLLQSGADVHIGNAFSCACQCKCQGHGDRKSCGRYEIVELLLANYDIESKDKSSILASALFEAARTGHSDIVELLLAKSADANAEAHGAAYQSHPITVAPLGGYYRIVEALLANGAAVDMGPRDVNMRGNRMASALQWASAGGHYEIVRLLLANGADVNAKGGHLGSALQLAAGPGHHEIVELLLAHGADIEARDDRSPSALQSASGFGQYETVRVLLENGANVNARISGRGSWSNMTALQLALERIQYRVADLLVAHGANE
ncbi:hypothetical protein TWF696_000367 [Orbilia brochopaga]|uniref:NACHT domain-containing protein n=1 Tax=Orbilia brochopaga TaxID=3140254 RepID=A0AAV9VCB4_9PEZI